MLLLTSQLSFLSANDLYLFDSGQGLMGLSIAPPPVREEWRPSLERIATSGRESRLAVVRPSPLGAVPSRLVVGSTATAVEVMVAMTLPCLSNAATGGTRTESTAGRRWWPWPTTPPDLNIAGKVHA